MFTWIKGNNRAGASSVVALSQSAFSQHLGKMREEGLVTFRRDAQTLYYRIDNPNAKKPVATLKALFCP